MFVGGPQSDLMSAPSPPLGPQSDWCVPYLPLSQGQDSLWSGVASVWPTCTLQVEYLQVEYLWCCFNGIWHISWGGSARCTGAGGADSAHFTFSGLLREGPCAMEREADPLEQWIHRITALGVCTVQASSLMGTGSLWDFSWGMGEGDGAGEHLCFPPS